MGALGVVHSAGAHWCVHACLKTLEAGMLLIPHPGKSVVLLLPLAGQLASPRGNLPLLQAEKLRPE